MFFKKIFGKLEIGEKGNLTTAKLTIWQRLFNHFREFINGIILFVVMIIGAIILTNGSVIDTYKEENAREKAREDAIKESRISNNTRVINSIKELEKEVLNIEFKILKSETINEMLIKLFDKQFGYKTPFKNFPTSKQEKENFYADNKTIDYKAIKLSRETLNGYEGLCFDYQGKKDCLYGFKFNNNITIRNKEMIQEIKKGEITN
jgi:hypothetical protein